jgi:hypothetical protein
MIGDERDQLGIAAFFRRSGLSADARTKGTILTWFIDRQVQVRRCRAGIGRTGWRGEYKSGMDVPCHYPSRRKDQQQA